MSTPHRRPPALAAPAAPGGGARRVSRPTARPGTATASDRDRAPPARTQAPRSPRPQPPGTPRPEQRLHAQARRPAHPGSPAAARPPAEAAPAVPAPAACYALVPAPLDFDGPLDTALFHQLDALVARTAQHRDLPTEALAAARGYAPATLFALAEVGHHYVLSGGTRLALVIFEGLTAIAPDEPYFALALGYTLDRAGRTDEACAAYRRAMALDPRDGRAELNLAEILLGAGARDEARAHLAHAEHLCRARGDTALADKARAIAARIGGRP